MFLFRLFRYVATDRRVDFFSINLDRPNVDQLTGEATRSFICCPIRSFEFGSNRFTQMKTVTRICQIRDPRDILVSEYFSIGWIHRDDHPELRRRREMIRRLSIDDYVIHEPEISQHPLTARLQPLLTFGLRPGQTFRSPSTNERILLVRYEDMVLNLESWLDQLIQPLGFRFPSWYRRKYSRQFRHEFDAKPESLTHKRRVIPGDYLEKLQASTIRILNQRFEPFLAKFGYVS